MPPAHRPSAAASGPDPINRHLRAVVRSYNPPLPHAYRHDNAATADLCIKIHPHFIHPFTIRHSGRQVRSPLTAYRPTRRHHRGNIRTLIAKATDPDHKHYTGKHFFKTNSPPPHPTPFRDNEENIASRTCIDSESEAPQSETDSWRKEMQATSR